VLSALFGPIVRLAAGPRPSAAAGQDGDVNVLAEVITAAQGRAELPGEGRALAGRQPCRYRW
jgi:hypothetical protein